MSQQEQEFPVLLIKGDELYRTAKDFQILKPQGYIAAGEFLKGINALLNEIDVACDKEIALANRLHRNLIEKKELYAKAPSEARTIIRSKMGDYKRREEEERARIEAQRRETQEKARKAAEEEERKQREALELRQREVLAAAEKAAAEGRHEDETKILDRAAEEERAWQPSVNITKPVDVPPLPARARVQGIYERKIPKWRIADESVIPREYLTPDRTLIGSIVQKKGVETRIPGIEVWMETIPVDRSQGKK